MKVCNDDTDDLCESRLRELWVDNKKSTPRDQQVQDLLMSEDLETLTDHREQAAESPDLYDGFVDDPFVRAAAMFRSQRYHGMIEVLTEAVESGVFAIRVSTVAGGGQGGGSSYFSGL